MVLGAGCPGRQAAGGATVRGGGEAGKRLGMGGGGRGDGECERLADRGPNAAAGDGHELSKKKVNSFAILGSLAPVLTHSTPLGLLLGLLPARPRSLRPYHKVWPAGPGREVRGMKEGYLRLAPIPSFRGGMIRERGQGRAVKRVRAGGYLFYLSVLFYFRLPVPASWYPAGSPVLRKNLGGGILAQMVAPVVAHHKNRVSHNS